MDYRYFFLFRVKHPLWIEREIFRNDFNRWFYLLLLRKQSFISYQVSITYRYLDSECLFLLVDNLASGAIRAIVYKRGH